MYEEEDDKKGSAFKIIEFMGMDNIADSDEITEQELAKIGMEVIEDFEDDEASREEWLEQNQLAIDVAKQTRKDKTFPWPNASNVTYPLISNAAMQFNARAYPEVVQGEKIVKAAVVGDDPTEEKAERAERVSEHMSYQLAEEIPNWEGDMDKLLLMLPIVGTMFKEVTWDEINLRPEINLLMPDELVVNYNAKSLDLSDCRRISKEVVKFKNDIKERERAGLWLELDYTEEAEGDETPVEKDEQTFIQQSRYLDLDGDGYEEPYIVMVHKQSSKVVRITALYDETTVMVNEEAAEVTKIEPLKTYTDYHFIPSMDGGFYSTGFGHYLFTTNQTISTLINQLIDAGTLSNTQGGFLGKGLRQKMGQTPFQPGEWRPVDSKGGDISSNIVPLPVREPSMVLYQLMVFLIDTGKEMSSITDVMAGVIQGANTPVGTTLAMIEQGMKVMDAVYKRVYLALKKEYKMLYLINHNYLDGQQYIKLLDNPQAQEGDYSTDDFDIVPVGDTRISSQMMRTMKAQALRDVAMSTPGANLNEAGRLLLKSMDIPDEQIDLVLPQGIDVPQLKQQVEFLQGQVGTFQEFIQSGQLQMAEDENARKNQESAEKANKDREQALKFNAETEGQLIENAMLESGVMELLEEDNQVRS
jgi:chaperonin GroES